MLRNGRDPQAKRHTGDVSSSQVLSRPLIVIVGGAPGTGKTTLAVPLAKTLELTLLSKDLIKESLMDSLGASDLATSQRIGSATWELLYRVAGWLLDVGVGSVIEGNFGARAREPLTRLTSRSRAVQISCRCADSLSQERYARRSVAPDRHPGHMDEVRIERGQLATSTFGPLDLGIPTLTVDTTDGYRPTLEQIVQFAEGGAMGSNLT